MKLEGTFLRSKVARRVLLSFVLAAFIPFLFLAVLYFVEANRMLVRQGHIQLQAASASYGRMIYDRLLLADLLGGLQGGINGSVHFFFIGQVLHLPQLEASVWLRSSSPACCVCQFF